MKLIDYPPHLHTVKLLLQSVHPAHHCPPALFVGPQGVGKFQWALMLGRALRCQVDALRTLLGAACACEPCRWTGEHPDSLTLDGSEVTLKIDDVKRLREWTRLKAPGFRVAILRDAHMLTPAAQNALLKTLEEPPPRMLIILTTHAPHRLLRTIRSRARTCRFAPIAEAPLRAYAHAHFEALSEESVTAAVQASFGSVQLLREQLQPNEAPTPPLQILMKQSLPKQLKTAERLAQSHAVTLVEAGRLATQLAAYARDPKTAARTRIKALRLFDELCQLVMRSEAHVNRRMLWESWLLGARLKQDDAPLPTLFEI